MTLALALATNRTRIGLSITLIEDLPLMMVIMAAMVLVLSGLVIDLGTGWPIGTATLGPAMVAAGMVLGLLGVEVLNVT